MGEIDTSYVQRREQLANQEREKFLQGLVRQQEAAEGTPPSDPRSRLGQVVQDSVSSFYNPSAAPGQRANPQRAAEENAADQPKVFSKQTLTDIGGQAGKVGERAMRALTFGAVNLDPDQPLSKDAKSAATGAAVGGIGQGSKPPRPVTFNDALVESGVSPEVAHSPWLDITGELLGGTAAWMGATGIVRGLTNGVLKSTAVANVGSKSTQFLEGYWKSLAEGGRRTAEQFAVGQIIGGVRAAVEGEPIAESAMNTAKWAGGIQGAIEIARLGVTAASKASGNYAFGVLQRTLDDLATWAYRNGKANSPEEAQLFAAQRLNREVASRGGFEGISFRDIFKFKKMGEKARANTPGAGPRDVTTGTDIATTNATQSRGLATPEPLNPAQVESIQSVQAPRELPYGWRTSREINKSIELENWAVLTAENPQHPDGIKISEGQSRNDTLIQWLLSKGYTKEDIIPETGFFEGIPSDKGFLVRGIAPEDVHEALKLFGQDSTATRAGLLYHDGTINPRQEGTTFHELAQTQTGYSILHSPSGDIPFSVNLDFSQRIPHPELGGGQAARQPQLDPEIMRVSDAYNAIRHNPNDPQVKASYDALKSEVLDTYGRLESAGYQIELYEGKGNPYKTTEEMFADLEQNGHLFVFKGGEPPADHPLSEPVPGMDGLTYNHLFRFVHDVTEHFPERLGFDFQGETKAWERGMQSYSEAARGAYTTETRGQLAANYALNEGNLDRPIDDIKFAEQKAGLLPSEFSALNRGKTKTEGPNLEDPSTIFPLLKQEIRSGKLDPRTLTTITSPMGGRAGVLLPDGNILFRATHGEALAAVPAGIKSQVDPIRDLVMDVSTPYGHALVTVEQLDDLHMTKRGTGTPEGDIQRVDQAIEELKARMGELENEISPEVMDKMGELLSERARVILQEVRDSAKPSFMQKIDQSANDARDRLNTRFKGKLYDVTGAAIESIGAIKDLTAIGVSILSNGVRDAKEFGTFLAYRIGQERGEVEIPQKLLDRVFKAAKSQFATLLRNAKKSEFPSTEQLIEMYKAGEFGGKWYNRAREEILRFTNGNVDDADKFTGLLAALSQSMGPRRNISMALDAWWAYKTGDEEALVTALKQHPYPAAAQNAMRALRGEPFGDSSFKVDNFRKNLLGDLETVTIDRRMKSIFGIPETTSIRESVHRNLEQIISDAAAVAGVKPAEFQAAVWAADGLLNKGAHALKTHGHIKNDEAKNFDDIFKDELIAFSEKLKAKGFNLDEEGKAHATLVFMLARALVGGAVGATEGDTPEERLRNALIGSGLFAASPWAIRTVSSAAAKLFRHGSVGQISEMLDRTGYADELMKVFDPKGMKTPGVPSPAMSGVANAAAGAAGAQVPPAQTFMTGPVIPAPVAGVTEKPKPTFEIRNLKPEQVDAFRKSNPDLIDIGDKAMKINWSEISDPTHIENVVKQLTAMNVQSIDKARRGTMSMQKTKELSRKMGVDFDQVMERRQGQALNAEESQAFIDFLGSSLRKTISTIEELALNPGDPDLETEFVHQLNIVKEVHEQVMGARAEAGRALNIWRTTAQGYIEVADQLVTTMNTVTPGQQTIAGSVTQVTPTRLAMLLRSTIPNQKALSKFVDKTTRPGAGDMFLEAMYGGWLLSNPATLSTNAIGNALTTVMAIPERLAAAGVGNLSKGLEAMGVMGPQVDHVSAREVAAFIYGMMNSVNHALDIAAHSFETGERTTGGRKIEMSPEKAITAENLAISGPIGHVVDFIGGVMRFSGRSLTSTDEFFKVINSFGQVYANGYRMADAQGLEGDDFAKSVVERFKDLPPEDIKQAKEFGDYQTFTQALGKSGQFVNMAINSMPMKYRIPVKLALPFFTVPTNIFKFAAERTPLAFVHQHFLNDIQAGGARRDLALGRLFTGTALILSAAYMTREGRVNGKGATKEAQRFVEQTARKQEYSVVMDDGTQIAFNRLDPYGMILGFGADWANIMFGHDDIDLSSRVFLSAVLPVAWNLTSKTYLEGSTRLLKAISGQNLADLSQFLKRESSIAVPGIVRQFNKLGLINEKYVRDSRGIWDNVISQIPGYSDTVPPDTDAFGHPVLIPGGLGPDLISGIAVSKRRDEPHYKALIEAKVGLVPPDDYIMGPGQADLTIDPADPRAGIKLTPQQQYRYRVLAGNAIKINGKGFEDAIKDLVESPRWTGSSDLVKQALVKGLHHVYKAKAEAELLREFPELIDKIKERNNNLRAAVKKVG